MGPPCGSCVLAWSEINWSKKGNWNATLINLTSNNEKCSGTMTENGSLKARRFVKAVCKEKRKDEWTIWFEVPTSWQAVHVHSSEMLSLNFDLGLMDSHVSWSRVKQVALNPVKCQANGPVRTCQSRLDHCDRRAQDTRQLICCCS